MAPTKKTHQKEALPKACEKIILIMEKNVGVLIGPSQK
jgi:hypothetical protein